MDNIIFRPPSDPAMKVKEKDEDKKEKREKLVKEEVPKAERGNMDKLLEEVVERIQ